LKTVLWINLAVAVLLAACGRPAQPVEDPTPAAARSGPLTERAGPVVWRASTAQFELNGQPLKTAKLWTFDGSTDGFTGVGSEVTPAPGQGLAVQVADPILRSPRGLRVPGGQFPLVLVRLTRVAPGSAWDGGLYYATASHGETVAYLGKPMLGADPKLNETTTLVYDMARQTVGAPDWTRSIIDQIRLDIEDRPGGAFVIRQVAIAENPAPDALAASPRP
jgi:hypothetical protein